MVGPEAFTELRYLEHQKQFRAYEVINEVSVAFKKQFGREAGGMIRTYHADDAETIIVAMGSVIGTLKDMIDEKRKVGEKIGLVSICSFRPFPEQDVARALSHASHVIVLEKSLSVGQSGVLATHVKQALKNTVPVTSLIAGLGGRPIPKSSLGKFVEDIKTADKGDMHFLDLNMPVVERELAAIEAYRKDKKERGNMPVKKDAAKSQKMRRAS